MGREELMVEKLHLVKTQLLTLIIRQLLCDHTVANTTLAKFYMRNFGVIFKHSVVLCYLMYSGAYLKLFLLSAESSQYRQSILPRTSFSSTFGASTPAQKEAQWGLSGPLLPGAERDEHVVPSQYVGAARGHRWEPTKSPAMYLGLSTFRLLCCHGGSNYRSSSPLFIGTS